MIRCGYCSHEFAEDEGIRSCGKCGKPGGCRMVRCPRCYYENPEEPKILKKIKGLFEGENR
jgi:predicted amidophosphoribosyltransferase